VLSDMLLLPVKASYSRLIMSLKIEYSLFAVLDINFELFLGGTVLGMISELLPRCISWNPKLCAWKSVLVICADGYNSFISVPDGLLKLKFSPPCFKLFGSTGGRDDLDVGSVSILSGTSLRYFFLFLGASTQESCKPLEIHLLQGRPSSQVICAL
jgi:hypothetical protein